MDYLAPLGTGMVSPANCRMRIVIVVDMPNHGGSPWLDRADYVTIADAIPVFMDTEGLAGATVLGHSMGGKAAMVLSMARPDLVAGLIVADIAPSTTSTETTCISRPWKRLI